MTAAVYHPPPRWWLALPTEPKQYHAFLRAPLWRWWRPLAAVGAFAVVWLLLSAIFAGIGMVLDGGATSISMTGIEKIGPWFFLANNVSLAAAIPIAMGLQWGIFGQKPGWLSSVAGRLRWRWLVSCLGVAAVVWVVMTGIQYLIDPPKDLGVQPYTVLLIVGIMLTTPFQAAGEEYMLRGFLARAVGSYFRSPMVGFIVATIVSAAVFMMLHGAADPWLNVFYVGFAVAASWITWRTGGLEAAIAIHVVNNMVAEAVMPWMDISDVLNREVGAGDASVLIHLGAIVLTAGILAWLGRRRGLTPAPVPQVAGSTPQATAADPQAVA